MEYPREFIDKAKTTYPNDIMLHNSISKGDVGIGSILYGKIQDAESIWLEWLMCCKEVFPHTDVNKELSEVQALKKTFNNIKTAMMDTINQIRG